MHRVVVFVLWISIAFTESKFIGNSTWVKDLYEGCEICLAFYTFSITVHTENDNNIKLNCILSDRIVTDHVRIGHGLYWMNVHNSTLCTNTLWMRYAPIQLNRNSGHSQSIQRAPSNTNHVSPSPATYRITSCSHPACDSLCFTPFQ